jgi:hypothetical protein
VPTKVHDAYFIGVCVGAMDRTIGKKPQSYLDAYVSSRAPKTASISAMRSRAAWLGHGIALIDTNRADAGILISALYSDDPTPGSSCGTQRASKVPWTPQRS